jgi:hypothetical protein
MSMAHSQKEINRKSLVELAEQLEASIRKAAQEGKSLYEVEKDTFGCALQIGHAAIEQLLVLQGDGDLGESVVTADGRRLERRPVPRKCRVGRERPRRLSERQNGLLFSQGRRHASRGVLRDRRRAASYV